MKRNLLLLKIIFGILFSNLSIYSQTNENIWFDGVSRARFRPCGSIKFARDGNSWGLQRLRKTHF